MRHPGAIRAGLVALGIPQAIVGAWALAAPHSFYEDFPTSARHWIASLGPYDRHLVTDVGGGLLALAVLVLLAALVLERRLVIVALITWLVFAVPHLAFHATHTDGLSSGDNAVNIVELGLGVAVPIALLALAWRPPASPAERPSSD
jgi:hypothetical protein